MRLSLARLAPLSLLLALGCPSSPVAPEPDPDPVLPTPTHLVDEVDVFVGTGFVGFGIGSTYPGPARPFAMVHPCPDTQGESSTAGVFHCSGYSHGDPWIAGVSHMRANGMGVPDYSPLAVMPSVGWDEGKRYDLGYRARKDPATETGRVGFYGVEVESTGGPISIELASGDWTALHRVTFPVAAGDQAGFVIDFAHTIPDTDFHGGELLQVDAEGLEWEGWLHFSGAYSRRHDGELLYAALRFDRAPLAAQSWSVEQTGGMSDPNVALGAWVGFDAGASPEVQLAVALSPTSIAAAWDNMEADLPAGFDFDGLVEGSRSEWIEILDRLRVGGGEPEERAIFASSAYHAFLMPTLYTDAAGTYLGFDGQIHQADGWTYYSDFSLWDTYRTPHPLYDLVAPEIEADFLRSLWDMGGHMGYMPRWPLGRGPTGGMIGDSAANVFAGAMAKGIGLDVIDPGEALAMFDVTAQRRAGQGSYFDLGWVAAETSSGSVSHTLEYCWNDAALAVLADVAGQPDRAEELRARSRSWRNHWDPEEGFLRARHASGAWAEPFDAAVPLGDYIEGTAWQYLWMAPHDIEGYIELFGSAEAVVSKLDQFFRVARAEHEENAVAFLPSAYYWHGNEPDMHASYLFAQLGAPELTAKWSRWVEESQYGLGPAGLPGNDDGGTMGAWYVFSALGFYPIAGTNDFVLGVPRFPVTELEIGGSTLRIEAPALTEALAAHADGVVEVVGVSLDGAPIDGPILRWEQIAGGGVLRFDVR